jgi:hypothetical protein
LKIDFIHLSAVQLRDSFIRQVNLLNEAISERTGDIIQLSARRFRRTRGTNLGRKGVSAFIIAEAAPKALAVALSFCRLLGLGCPKQAFAKIATPR